MDLMQTLLIAALIPIVTFATQGTDECVSSTSSLWSTQT